MFSIYNIYNIFFKLITIWLLIDCINGFLLSNNIGVPISQLYKIGILCILFIGLIKIRQGIPHIYMIISYSTILILHISCNIIMPELGLTLNHLMKFINTILIYIFVKEYVKANPQDAYNKINNILIINTFILVTNILLGLFGFGYSAYIEGLGYRGFFYAGNELSGLMTLLFPYILYKTGETYSYKSPKYIFSVILFLITAALLGTKTSLLMILLTIIILPNLSIKLSKLYKLILPLCFVLTTISVGVYFLLNYLGLMERWIYFTRKEVLKLYYFLEGQIFGQKKKILYSTLVYGKNFLD